MLINTAALARCSDAFLIRQLFQQFVLLNGSMNKQTEIIPAYKIGGLIHAVSCNMKLYSVLLGGAIQTKPCVCPQVLHGSMRLMGCPEVGATVRGMKPSRKCSKPGSLKAGGCARVGGQ